MAEVKLVDQQHRDKLMEELRFRFPYQDFKDNPEAMVAAIERILARNQNLYAIILTQLPLLKTALKNLMHKNNISASYLTEETYDEALEQFLPDLVTRYTPEYFGESLIQNNPYTREEYRPQDFPSGPDQDAQNVDHFHVNGASGGLNGGSSTSSPGANGVSDLDGTDPTDITYIDEEGLSQNGRGFQNGDGRHSTGEVIDFEVVHPDQNPDLSNRNGTHTFLTGNGVDPLIPDTKNEQVIAVAGNGKGSFAKRIGESLWKNRKTIAISFGVGLIFGPLGLLAPVVAFAKHSIKAVQEDYNTQFLGGGNNEFATELSYRQKAAERLKRGSKIVVSREFWNKNGKKIGIKTGVSGVSALAGFGLHELLDIDNLLDNLWPDSTPDINVAGLNAVSTDTLSASEIPAVDSLSEAGLPETDLTADASDEVPTPLGEDAPTQTDTLTTPSTAEAEDIAQSGQTGEPEAEPEAGSNSGNDQDRLTDIDPSDLAFEDRIQRYISMVAEEYPGKFDSPGATGAWAMRALENYSPDTPGENTAWQILELVYGSQNPELIQEASDLVEMLDLDATNQAAQLAVHNEGYVSALSNEMNSAADIWGEQASSGIDSPVTELSRKRLLEME